MEQFIFVIIPSIIWFYYFFSGNECNSPVDDIISTICIFYCIIIVLFIILGIINFLKYYCNSECMDAIKFCFPYLYLVAILTLLIIIGIKVQIKYFDNWENNTCNYLKGFVLAWQINNYIQMIKFLLICVLYCYGCFLMCKFYMSD